MRVNVKPCIPKDKSIEEAVRRMDGWKPLAERVIDTILPLPMPKELGRSDSNALPMRDLGLNDDDDAQYCWEDWEAEMRRDYPIAWFLRHKAPKPFKRAWWNLEEAVYWLKCHTLPSYRFNVLDLRDPGGGEHWKYGWRDRTSVMLLACFKILVDFVELEEPGDMEAFTANMTEEEIESQGLTKQLADYREVMDLYRWWKTGRQAEDERISRMFKEANAIEDKKAKAAAKEAWLAAHRVHDEQDQVNLLRLIAIREYLWT